MSKIPALNKAMDSFFEKPDETIELALKEISKEDEWFDLVNIGAAAARELMNGHSHGSDLLDESSDLEIMDFLGIEESSEDSDSFDKYDYMDSVRETFSEKFFEKLTPEVLLDKESFKKLYNQVKKVEGLEKLSPLEFSKALVKSYSFVSSVGRYLKSYQG